MNRPRLIFIVGPTASGKTSLALDLAEELGAPVLSCDSLCVYRGMDIGTAKPTAAEQARIPHYGIDLCGPDESFSVARYVAYRDALLGKCLEAGHPVVVAGGSGFYLKSFFAPVADSLEVPAEVEARVEDIDRTGGLEGLLGLLKSIHGESETFAGLDMRNPRRVRKALIRCLASGQSYSDLLEAFQSLPEPLPGWEKEVRLIVRPAEDLRKRNARRVKQMLADGLVDEVRRLRAAGFERNPSACRAIGYREVLAWLDSPAPVTELVSAITTHTNQLMRKQRAWFRHQIPVTREIRL